MLLRVGHFSVDVDFVSDFSVEPDASFFSAVSLLFSPDLDEDPADDDPDFA